MAPQAAEALLETTSPESLELLWELAEREESSVAAVSSLAARGEATLPGARAAVADASPRPGSAAASRAAAVLAPGLTGLAQISAPYASSFEESAGKLASDLYYVARCSFGLDLAILASTFFEMFGCSFPALYRS